MSSTQEELKEMRETVLEVLKEIQPKPSKITMNDEYREGSCGGPSISNIWIIIEWDDANKPKTEIKSGYKIHTLDEVMAGSTMANTEVRGDAEGISGENIQNLKNEIDKELAHPHECNQFGSRKRQGILWVKELIESYVETEAILSDKEPMAQLEESKKSRTKARDFEEVCKELKI